MAKKKSTTKISDVQALKYFETIEETLVEMGAKQFRLAEQRLVETKWMSPEGVPREITRVYILEFVPEDRKGSCLILSARRLFFEVDVQSTCDILGHAFFVRLTDAGGCIHGDDWAEEVSLAPYRQKALEMLGCIDAAVGLV